MTQTADYPDYDPIPQLSVVTPGSVSVTAGGNAVLVDPGANHAVRLWTLSISGFHSDTANPDFISVLAGAETIILIRVDPASASVPYKTTQDNIYMGGIVLPKGAAVSVTCGTSVGMEATLAGTYTLT